MSLCDLGLSNIASIVVDEGLMQGQENELHNRTTLFSSDTIYLRGH